MKFSVFILAALACRLSAAPATTDPHIKVDQFGYRTLAQKVAVISDPVTGFNTPDPYGAAPASFQVRRWSDDGVAFSNTVTAWSAGATHTDSGDRAWWFDFSALT